MLNSIALLATIASTAAPRWARVALGTFGIVRFPVVVLGIVQEVRK